MQGCRPGERMQQIHGVGIVRGDHWCQYRDQREEHDEAGTSDPKRTEAAHDGRPRVAHRGGQGQDVHCLTPATLTRGSRTPYSMSTNVLTTTNAATKINVIAWTTWKSFCSTDVTR